MLRKSFLLMLVAVLLLGFVGDAHASVFMTRPNPMTPGEPAICFEQEKGWAKWRVKGNTVNICFNMENIDSSAMIDAFDIEIYCTDIYEKIIYPSNCDSDDYKMTYTIKKKIKPEKTAYSSYCKISNYEGIAYVHAAVTKYHYKKGSSPCGGCIYPDSTNTVIIPEKDISWGTWEID